MGGRVPTTRREALALLGTAMLAGGASGSVAARATGDRQHSRADDARQRRTVRAYVGSYHWGYFLLDQNGEQLDQVTLSTGDELRLTAFNVEAEEAVAALPGPVRSSIPSADEREKRNQQSIPVPSGVDLTDLHEAAEAAYPDHSIALVADAFLVGASGGAGPGGRGRGGGQGVGPGRGGMTPGGGMWGGHHGPGYPGGMGPGGMGPGAGQHGPWMGGSAGFAGMLAPPTYLWHHSTVPSEIGFVVDEPGSYGFACTVYCGYGHPYMAEQERIVVQE